MKLSSPKIKKVFIFSQKIFFLTFQEMELSSPKIEKFQDGTFRV